MRPAGQSPSLLVSCYFPRAVALEGVGTFVTGLAEGMARAGWNVELLVPRGGGEVRTRVAVSTYRPGAGGLWRYRRAVRARSAGADAVLLVENNPNMALSAGWTARPERAYCYFYTPLLAIGSWGRMGWGRQGLAHVATKSPLWARLQRWSPRRCIVATEFQAAQLRRLGAAEVHVVTGSSLSREQAAPGRPSARAELGWGPDEPIVGYLGHYSRAKGVEDLIAAASAPERPFALALAHSGKGRLKPAAARTLEELRRGGRVRELGVVDPLTFLAGCDLVALPYVTASNHHLPQVMLESFAAGTAVVTTDVGGLAEAKQGGEVGVWVPPRSPAALAGAICRLLAAPGAPARMGRNARRYFEARLCREVFCGRLTEIIGGVGGGRGRRCEGAGGGV